MKRTHFGNKEERTFDIPLQTGISLKVCCFSGHDPGVRVGHWWSGKSPVLMIQDKSVAPVRPPAGEAPPASSLQGALKFPRGKALAP